MQLAGPMGICYEYISRVNTNQRISLGDEELDDKANRNMSPVDVSYNFTAGKVGT